MSRLGLTCGALLLSASLADAGIENAGTTAGNFLSIGSGAAVLSMGGATIGTASGLNGAAWNPAALGWLGGSEFAMSHAALADQTSQEWAAYGSRFGRAGTRWSVTGLFQSQGSFEGRDASNVPTGSFDASSMAFGLQFAQPFGERFSVGLGTQYVSENLGSATGSGLGFDAGVQGRAGDVGFGLAARNLGGKLRYASGSYDLPGNVGLGVAWAPHATGLRFALDANFPSAYYNDVRFGAEWRWQDRLALRAGYRKELSAPAGELVGGPSFGVGTGVSGWWLDYGFLTGGASGQSQHRLGVTFRPNLLNLGAGGALGAKSEAEKSTPAKSETPKLAKAESTKQPEIRHTKTTSEPVAAKATKPAKGKKHAPPPPITTPPLPKPAAAVPVATLPLPKPTLPAAPVAATPVTATPVEPLRLTVPNGGGTTTGPRATAPATVALAPTKPVQAPKAQLPEPEPVAVRTPPTSPVLDSAPPAVAVPPAVVATPPAVAAAPPAAKPPVVVESKPAAPRPATVTVRHGETLQIIAERWGTTAAAIMMENNLVTERVSPGRKLKLPPPSRR